MANPVTFIHHQPELRNIGDELCSPKHYFRLDTARDRLAIVGGGAYADFGLKAISANGFRPDEAVLWGAGRSIRDTFANLPQVTQLPYLSWGIRDIDALPDTSHFLPCVSCLHPMLDQPISGDGTLLFVNAATRITTDRQKDELRELAQRHGWQYLQNSCSDAELQSALKANRRVITNSFHGAYWSLLSGHQVQIIGYSSKFSSLLRGMGLEPHQLLARYTRMSKLQRWVSRLLNRPSELCTQIEAAAHGGPVITLPEASSTLQRFRTINLAFADALVSHGILCQATPRSWADRHAE